MTRWEYKRDVMPPDIDRMVERLNELGEDGWEVVAIRWSQARIAIDLPHIFVVILKRAIIEE